MWASIARTITTPILLLCLVQCGFVGGFFPNFAIFALVSDHLRNFRSFPSRGLSLFLAFVPLLEAMSESLTHSFPRSFLVVALSASAVGFADALWLCPGRFLRRFFASVSWFAPVALSPLLHRVFPDGFRLWCAFHFYGGASPLALVP